MDVVDRIELTMQEVGLSVSLTTLTTLLAFILGSFSTIPGVRWLCFYAASAIVCDYVYQITFFVALLVLDERRIQAYHQNCCFWRMVPPPDDDEYDVSSHVGVIATESMDEDHIQRVGRHNNNNNNKASNKLLLTEPHFAERFMIRYANLLMKPFSKIIVLLGFGAYFAFSLYRATLLTQEFNVEDYVPADSYLRGTLYAMENYYSLKKPFEVYFRDVDQSDPDIQQQMREYINELAALPQIGEEAPFCWVRDFEQIPERFPQYADLLDGLSFQEQLNFAMNNPTIREVYGEDIVQDEFGNITASRCLLFLRNLDLAIVDDQIDMLLSQREISASQPINQDKEEWSFFAFDSIFFYWELYAQAVEELLFTISTGIIAVTAVTFVLIPHYTAVFFVAPGIIILYCNFLGKEL
jgi:predicted RND superfamily exporter protein